MGNIFPVDFQGKLLHCPFNTRDMHGIAAYSLLNLSAPQTCVYLLTCQARSYMRLSDEGTSMPRETHRFQGPCLWNIGWAWCCNGTLANPNPKTLLWNHGTGISLNHMTKPGVVSSQAKKNPNPWMAVAPVLPAYPHPKGRSLCLQRARLRLGGRWIRPPNFGKRTANHVRSAPKNKFAHTVWW